MAEQISTIDFSKLEGVNTNTLPVPTTEKITTPKTPLKKSTSTIDFSNLEGVTLSEEQTTYEQPVEDDISTETYISDEPSVWEKIAYGVDKQNQFLGNVLRVGKAGLEAAFDSEREFKEVAMENAERERKELNLRHKKFASGAFDDDNIVKAAEMATFLLDPYYILAYMTPWGRAATVGTTGIKATMKLAGLSGGVIGLDKLFENLATQGEVKPGEVAITTASGAVLGPLAVKTFRTIGKMLPGADKKQIANIVGVIEGKTATKLGISPAEYKTLQKIAGNKTFLELNKQVKKADESFVKEIYKKEGSFLEKIRSLDKQISKLKGDEKYARKKDIKFSYKDKYIKNVSEKIAQLEKDIVTREKVFNKAQIQLVKRKSAASKKLTDTISKRDVFFLEQMWKEKNLFSKGIQLVLASTIRPVMGGGVGYAFGKLWGPEDANLDKWFWTGATLGAIHKGVMASKILPGQSKNLIQRVIYTDATKLAFQKVRELTSTTTASKLSALGGESEKIGLMLLENIDSSFTKNSVARRADTLYRTWQRRAFEMVAPYNQQEQALALSIVRGNQAKVSTRVNKLANTLRDELVKFKKLYNEAGIFSINEPIAGRTFGKLRADIKNYFPRVYNFDAIKRDPEKFEQVITKIAKSLSTKNKPISDAQAKSMALSFTRSLKNEADSVINKNAYAKIIEGLGVKESGHFLKKNPLSEHITKARILQGPYSKVEKVLKDNGYLVDDIPQVLQNLYNRSMKSIAFAEKFGARGELLRPYIQGIGKKYKDLFDAGRIGANWKEKAAHEINLVEKTIDAYFGRYGQTQVGTGKSIAGVLATISNLNMLDRVTIASLGDLVQPFTLSANWLAFWKGALRTGFTIKREKGIGKNLNLALSNEINTSLLRSSAIGQQFDDATKAANVMGKMGLGRKVNEFGFKWMGLQWLTGLARRYAYNVGAVDAYTSARKLAVYVSRNKKATLDSGKGLKLMNDLNKYGIDAQDALKLGSFNTFDDAVANKSVNTLLNTSGILASNRDALIPQVSNRLLFTQSRNPWVRLMGQFTSWAMAKSTQTNKLLQRIENGDVRQLVKLSAALPVYGGIQMLRELSKYGEIKTDPSTMEGTWWAEAIRLSGMGGILPELIAGRLTGPGSDMPWFIPFPAASVATDVGTIAQNVVAGDTDKAMTRFMEKIAPFPTWRRWLVRLFGGIEFTRKYNNELFESLDVFKKPKFSKGGRVGYNTGDVVESTIDFSNLEGVNISEDKYVEGDGLKTQFNFSETEKVIEPHVEEKTQLPKEEISEIETYVPLIKSYEGHGDKIYDSKGNVIAYKNYRLGDEKHITSGYGFYDKSNRENDSVTVEQAEKDLRKNIKIKLEAAKKGIKNFESLSNNLKQHIVSSWYRGSLSGSPLTRELINAGKFEKAAKEFLNNAEYRAAVESGSGVAARMEAVAEALRNEANK